MIRSRRIPVHKDELRPRSFTFLQLELKINDIVARLIGNVGKKFRVCLCHQRERLRRQQDITTQVAGRTKDRFHARYACLLGCAAGCQRPNEA